MAVQKRGITIEFDANISKLDKAIKDINKKIGTTDKELKKVEKALKFNPSSVDLWKQKQTLLTQKIAETEKKLDSLKQKQKEMDANNVDKNSEEYRKLQREIIETESKLKHFKAELRELGNVNLKALGEKFKEIGAEMEKVGKTLTQKITAPITAVYAASAKAALTYGDAIAKVSTIADDSQVPIESLKKSIMDLSNETGKSSTELAEAAYQALSASVETKDVMAFLEDATGLAKAGFLETADAVDVLTTIINAYGMSAEDASKIANELVQTQNDGKTTVNELAAAMGTVIPTASALNIPLEQLNASYVLMTKQGINTANATTYLNGMFTELADGGSTVSEILQSETGKTFGQLMKEGASLGDVLDILNKSVDGDSEAFLNLWGNTRAGRGALSLLNGGVDEFNAEVVTMENSLGNVDEALGKLATPGAAARKALNELVNVGIQIGDVLAPYIQKAATFIQSLLDKFYALSPETQKIIVMVGAIIAAIGPVLLIGGKIMTLIGTVMTGISKIIGIVKAVGAVISVLASTGLLPIIAIIAAVVAAGILLYKNWDVIKAKATALWNAIKTTFNGIKTAITTTWNNIKASVSAAVDSVKNKITSTFNALKSTVSSIWNAIKTAITNPIQTAVNLVKGFVNKLKGMFPVKVGKIFSGMKLPHFKVSGGVAPWGIGGKGSKPSISVDWYAKGGIFNSPSVIGVGEAGSEAVVPLDTLWKKLDAIALASGGGAVVVNVYGSDNMSVNELAAAVEQKLIQMQKRRTMAWQ